MLTNQFVLKLLPHGYAWSGSLYPQKCTLACPVCALQCINVHSNPSLILMFPLQPFTLYWLFGRLGQFPNTQCTFLFRKEWSSITSAWRSTVIATSMVIFWVITIWKNIYVVNGFNLPEHILPILTAALPSICRESEMITCVLIWQYADRACIRLIRWLFSSTIWSYTWLMLKWFSDMTLDLEGSKARKCICTIMHWKSLLESQSNHFGVV